MASKWAGIGKGISFFPEHSWAFIASTVFVSALIHSTPNWHEKTDTPNQNLSDSPSGTFYFSAGVILRRCVRLACFQEGSEGTIVVVFLLGGCFMFAGEPKKTEKNRQVKLFGMCPFQGLTFRNSTSENYYLIGGLNHLFIFYPFWDKIWPILLKWFAKPPIEATHLRQLPCFTTSCRRISSMAPPTTCLLELVEEIVPTKAPDFINDLCVHRLPVALRISSQVLWFWEFGH